MTRRAWQMQRELQVLFCHGGEEQQRGEIMMRMMTLDDKGREPGFFVSESANEERDGALADPLVHDLKRFAKRKDE
jgi:hypothetical protein